MAQLEDLTGEELPALPEKTSIFFSKEKLLSPEFVETRRVQLEQFLRDLIACTPAPLNRARTCAVRLLNARC